MTRLDEMATLLSLEENEAYDFIVFCYTQKNRRLIRMEESSFVVLRGCTSLQ